MGGRGGVLVPQVARSAVSPLRGWSVESHRNPLKSVGMALGWCGVSHYHVLAKCARGHPRKRPGSTPNPKFLSEIAIDIALSLDPFVRRQAIEHRAHPLASLFYCSRFPRLQHQHIPVHIYCSPAEWPLVSPAALASIGAPDLLCLYMVESRVSIAG